MKLDTYQTFSHIYVTLTGKQHTPQIIEQCKAKYTEGLRASFKDEQNHAVWFLYFLTASINNASLD